MNLAGKNAAGQAQNPTESSGDISAVDVDSLPATAEEETGGPAAHEEGQDREKEGEEEGGWPHWGMALSAF